MNARTILVDDFDQVLLSNYDGLFRFGLSLTGSANSALDLTHRTICLALQSEGQLRELRKARSWLLTILYRTFLKTGRNQTRFPHLTLDEKTHESPDVAPETVERLDSAIVIEALAHVDEIFRGPLALFYLEEMTHDEIAAVLDMPLGMLISSLSLGKAQLRAGLQSATRRTNEPAASARRRVRSNTLHRHVPDVRTPRNNATPTRLPNDTTAKPEPTQKHQSPWVSAAIY